MRKMLKVVVMSFFLSSSFLLKADVDSCKSDCEVDKWFCDCDAEQARVDALLYCAAFHDHGFFFDTEEDCHEAIDQVRDDALGSCIFEEWDCKNNCDNE